VIRNVHERELPATQDRIGALLDRVAEPANPLWPAERWPPLRLDRPLAVGATGGHGPIRYVCTGYVPGRSVEFTFDPAVGLLGTHRLSVLDGPGPHTCVLRHVLTGQSRTARAQLRWLLATRWLHDALLEDLLDNASRAAGQPPEHPARWSPWVRLLMRHRQPAQHHGQPGRFRRHEQPVSPLDQLLPAAHFAERHGRDVAGSPEGAYAATRAITLAEMPLARTLFSIRGLSAKSSAPVSQVKDPLLSQMLARGFSVLVDRPGSEFVIGAIAQPWRLRGGDTVPLPTPTTFVEFDGSGYVKMAMSFRYDPRGNGTRITTETRVLATDAASRGAFARYWVPVRPGSGLIRRAMLKAIARRTSQALVTATTQP